MTPIMHERLGSVESPRVHTDGHRAYPAIAASLPGSSHGVVIHKDCFKDPDTGVHTNNVEGEHGVWKRESRVQFCRLPSVKKGKVYYLDLVVWRSNVRLDARAAQHPPAFYRPFSKPSIRGIETSCQTSTHQWQSLMSQKWCRVWKRMRERKR